jgi:hypothetical protein
MISDNDERETRCRRLGHTVSFAYCRTQEGQTVCPCILDCWWQIFDVQAFLKEYLTDEEFARLAERQPAEKVTTLLDLIRKAQERAPGD